MPSNVLAAMPTEPGYDAAEADAQCAADDLIVRQQTIRCERARIVENAEAPVPEKAESPKASLFVNATCDRVKLLVDTPPPWSANCRRSSIR